MKEIIKTMKTVGPKHLLKLRRGYRAGWQDTISGFYTTRTIQALLNVGFFDEVMNQGEVHVESFAQARKLEPTILLSLCDSLYSLKILNKDGALFSLTRKGRLLVEVARGWFDSVYGYGEVLHSLEALLKKEKTYGADVVRLGDFVAKGSGEIEDLLFFPLANDLILRGGYQKVLDLGCGDGTFLGKLCRKNPHVTGYGIDLAPAAIGEGLKRMSELGMEDRVHLLAGDICKIDSAPRAFRDVDVATAFFVLHEILYRGDDAVIQFMTRFRNLFPGVPLIVFEAIRPTADEMRKRPGMAIHYFLYHDLSHQKPVDRPTWRDLFASSGFRITEERYINFAKTAIFVLNGTCGSR